jgi:hypothetical protein
MAVPATSAPPSKSKHWVNCYKVDGPFTVVHNGDTIDGESIPAGKYKIWAKYLRSCGNASIKFHNWLAVGHTPDSWSFTKTRETQRTVWYNAKKKINSGKLAGKHKNIQFRYIPPAS